MQLLANMRSLLWYPAYSRAIAGAAFTKQAACTRRAWIAKTNLISRLVETHLFLPHAAVQRRKQLSGPRPLALVG